MEENTHLGLKSMIKKESFRLPEVTLITLRILFQFLRLAGAVLAELQYNLFTKVAIFQNNLVKWAVCR